ncbi:putative NADH-cytochrome B5 reductase [Amylocarpus encephaloides]|uniref:NADH-cytochrome b5 reductase n=1 Tax=Amylocarpus encephaloides TaxID=45428 RepID=A0A9P8C1Q9_9HELO|nr:putative NADH-cytochrome B5 reductase [Amylocarpus encephaloides]
MLGISRPVLRSQSTPVAVAAAVALATVGVYSFYSTSSKSTPPKTFGRGPALTSLRLYSIETLSPDTKRFRFALPTGDAVSGLDLTSALLTLSRPKGKFWPVVRPYTPIGDLAEPGFIDLAIKKYPNGKASTHIHSLEPGDSLFILGVIRGYPWKLNEASRVTMIAGGAGITPMHQLILNILKTPSERTKITLVFGINSDADALFRSEFSELQDKSPDRFKVLYTVTSPSKGSPYLKGRMTKELLKQVMGEERSGKVFVCGPPGLEKALMGDGRGKFGGILGELGYEKGEVYKF